MSVTIEDVGLTDAIINQPDVETDVDESSSLLGADQLLQAVSSSLNLSNIVSCEHAYK